MSSLRLLQPSANSPAALGYRMPAEWAPHAATWLSWPRNPDTWPGQFAPIPGVWAELARVLATSEPVKILAGGEPAWEQAQRLIGQTPNVELLDIPTNDCWMRDHGPMFLVGRSDSPPALVHWGYNAWGGKYPPYELDQQVPRLLAERLGRVRFEPGIILEGGAVDGNGLGTLLTTEECLLNLNRNPELDRAAVEQYLCDYTAARHVVWLGRCIVGDDTDGHIDELARFVGPRTVLAVIEPDPLDENHEPLVDNLARLRRATDQDGRALEVVTLALPRPVFFGDHRLPASYANFYLANRLVIVPQFGDPADAVALDTLGRLFPERRVVGLAARQLAWGLGTFHCITQQEPALDAA